MADLNGFQLIKGLHVEAGMHVIAYGGPNSGQRFIIDRVDGPWVHFIPATQTWQRDQRVNTWSGYVPPDSDWKLVKW